MTIYAVGSGAGGHNWKFRRGQRKEVTGNLLDLLGESSAEPLDIREVYDRGIVADGSFGASVEVSVTQGSHQVRPPLSTMS